MKAKINTKSNFRNLNGEWLTVSEMKGDRVTCVFNDDQSDKTLLADFKIYEIEAFDYDNPNKALLQFMHDAVGKVNNIQSLAGLIRKELYVVNERSKMMDMIITSAVELNSELDSYYSKNKI